MEGITILSSTKVFFESHSPWSIYGGIIAFIVALIVLAILCIVTHTKFEGIVIVVSLAIGFLAGSIIYSTTEQQIFTGRYEHKALISDTVDFKNVYDKYEVKGTDGQIYLLEEKSVTDPNT